MIKFCLLASGSKGNAVWVESGGLALAVDSGLSAKEFMARAAAAGLDLTRLAAILISHEHRDHISGVGPLARKLNLKVLATRETAEAAGAVVGQVNWEFFKSGDSLDLAPFKVRTLPISHDAADPLAFVFDDGDGPLGLATDLGVPTHLLRQKLAGMRSLILEFNHDYQMLMEGPYPWPLKQRVRSRQGHLANDVGAELAAELCHPGLRHLVLAHLSETNNSPELALAAAAAKVEGPEITAAPQHKPSKVFE